MSVFDAIKTINGEAKAVTRDGFGLVNASKHPDITLRCTGDRLSLSRTNT